METESKRTELKKWIDESLKDKSKISDSIICPNCNYEAKFDIYHTPKEESFYSITNITKGKLVT